MISPLLKVENLTTYFNITSGILGKTTHILPAVDDVSFGIDSSQTLSLVGESGCGKSTVARSILRLIPPKSGKILFKGVDVLNASNKEMFSVRANMQMIFQDPFSSLDPRMSVANAIAEPLRTHKICNRNEVADRVNELLIRVGLLPEHGKRFPHEFSGGQRQRICIARALGPKPALIIADEAISSLDVTIQAQIINLLMDLQDEYGISYLFISHDMAVVERISHIVAIMYLGKIVEIGSRAQVFENPKHSYTLKLLNSVPIPDPTVKKEREKIPFEEIPPRVKEADFVSDSSKMLELEPGHFVSLN